MPLRSLAQPLLAVSLLTIATAVAFSPALSGSTRFWLLVSAPVGALACYSLLVLHRAGKLTGLLRPRPGDLTVGALVGAILLLISWAIRSALMAQSSRGQSWLFFIDAQLGDPRVIGDSVAMTLLLFGVVFSEELVFRGWIQERLSERAFPKHAWILQACLFATTLLPTTVTLADGGFNPLLLGAGLGCSLVFGLMRQLSGRLLPGLVAHAVFTYFSVAQFRIPGL